MQLEIIHIELFYSRNHRFYYLSFGTFVTYENYIIAGYNVSCVGDDRTYSYIESPYANTLADRVAQNVLHFHYPKYKRYSFLNRGSDERQYCSPLVRLPLCAICRSKYEEYPEYHTSADDLSLVTPSGLQGAYDVYSKCLDFIEYNGYYQVTTYCEPQLGNVGCIQLSV